MMIAQTEAPSALCPDALTWDALMRDYRLAQVRAALVADAYRAGSHETDLLCDLSDEAGDMECAAGSRLMDCPAPHAAALRWKLEKLFSTDDLAENGYTESWSLDYVRQTIADFARLLPDRP